MKIEVIATLEFTKDSPEEMDPFSGPIKFFGLTSITRAEVLIAPPLAEWTNPDVQPKLLVKAWIVTGGGEWTKAVAVNLDYDPDQRCLTIDGKRIDYRNITAVSEKCDEVYQKYFEKIRKEEE